LLYVVDATVQHISFFFQAEDGIRARNVTGVQTCALPISVYRPVLSHVNLPRPDGRQYHRLRPRYRLLPHLAGRAAGLKSGHLPRYVADARRTLETPPL